MADKDYLETVDDIRLVRKALSEARKLENAERQVKESRVIFGGLSQDISMTIKMSLWHTDDKGGKYFWRRRNADSIYYPSRVSALEALLNENIDWLGGLHNI